MSHFRKNWFLFYTTISNGCEIIDDFPLRAFEDWKYNREFLIKEFPFEKYYIWEDETDETFDIKAINYGNIELIDIGCGQTWNIIVCGKEYGKM